MDYAAWHSVVTDDNGKVVPLASITVRHTDTGALARLYNSRDGSEPKGNPFQTGADGMISFFAAGGAYTIVAAQGSLERRWSFVPIGTAAEYDIDSLAEYLNSGVVYFQTFADMGAYVPLNYPAAAVVLADADALKNGYYTNSGAGWVFGRALQDTISQLFVTGGGVNNPTATVGQGINPSAPLMFYIDIASPNTGSVTLNISGVGQGVVLNVAGNPLAAGEWQGRIMLTRLPDGRYKLMNDPASALSAALSATEAGDARDAAVTAKDQSESAKAAAEGSATAAATSATNASNSAAASAGSASAADNSATDAAGSASTATTKANEAASSASDAADSAITATTKAGEAASSAADAAGSAASAANSATDAIAQAGRAEDEADRAEQAAASVESPVSYAPQTLTPAQQAQARTNIDALGASEQAVDSAKLGGSLASDYMLKTWTLTAGNGLSGGGSGAANRALAVGKGTGITVAATSVSVDETVWRDGNKPTGAMLASVIGSMAAGALGTYALARNGSSTNLSFGDNVSGASLRFANTSGNAVAGTGTGSWKCMGYAKGNATPDSITQFLRYA